MNEKPNDTSGVSLAPSDTKPQFGNEDSGGTPRPEPIVYPKPPQTFEEQAWEIISKWHTQYCLGELDLRDLQRRIIEVQAALRDKMEQEKAVATCVAAAKEAEAVREGERRQAVAEAREKALRERLENLGIEWHESLSVPHSMCADQLRAILEETK